MAKKKNKPTKKNNIISWVMKHVNNFIMLMKPVK